METFYHGSTVLFDHFDLSHVTEGDGKVKFGYGVYVTEKYSSAVTYSYNKSRPEMKHHYIYTVEVPDKTPTNFFYLDPQKAVEAALVARIENALGEPVPHDIIGKEMRRYLANRLLGRALTPKKMIAPDIKDVAGEKAAAELLQRIGIDFIEWPYTWGNPANGSHRAVFDAAKVKIVRIEEIQLDAKRKLVPGSEVIVKQF